MDWALHARLAAAPAPHRARGMRYPCHSCGRLRICTPAHPEGQAQRLAVVAQRAHRQPHIGRNHAQQHLGGQVRQARGHSERLVYAPRCEGRSGQAWRQPLPERRMPRTRKLGRTSGCSARSGFHPASTQGAAAATCTLSGRGNTLQLARPVAALEGWHLALHSCNCSAITAAWLESRGTALRPARATHASTAGSRQTHQQGVAQPPPAVRRVEQRLCQATRLFGRKLGQ